MTDTNLPPLPEPPVAWRVRGYAQFKTGKPGPWRYFDGSVQPSVNTPDCCDVEPVYSAAQVEEIRRAAILAERERCAKVCEAEAMLGLDDERSYYGKLMAAAIREGDK